MRNLAKHFFETGWCRFPHDSQLSAWVDSALASARATLQGPGQSKWLRYQGTWVTGVNALPNNDQGAVGTSGPLRGEVVDFISSVLGLEGFPWDAAQVSACYPGYPQPMDGESPGRARYWRERDAAHVDGLLPEGPERQRHLCEHHEFILVFRWLNLMSMPHPLYCGRVRTKSCESTLRPFSQACPSSSGVNRI